MPPLGLIGIVLLVLLLLGALATRIFAAAPPAAPLPAKELEERPARLAKIAPRVEAHPVAMCYKPAAHPRRSTPGSSGGGGSSHCTRRKWRRAGCGGGARSQIPRRRRENPRPGVSAAGIIITRGRASWR